MGYAGSVIGGLATLIAVIFAVHYGAKYERPVMKMYDIEVLKKKKEIRDIISYVGYNSNYQDSNSNDYQSILSFRLSNKGQSNAVNIKVSCNKKDECKYDVHMDSESNDSDILTKDDALICNTILSKTIKSDECIEYYYTVSYDDYLYNKYKDEYYIKMHKTKKNKYKLDKITLIMENKKEKQIK